MTTNDPAVKAAAEFHRWASSQPADTPDDKGIAELAAIIRRAHEPYLRLLERAVDWIHTAYLADQATFKFYGDEFRGQAESFLADAASLGIGTTDQPASRPTPT